MSKDYFDISVKLDKQDAMIQKIKAYFATKKNTEFDMINHKFSGGGIDGRWMHAGFNIRIYIDKRPTVPFTNIPLPGYSTENIKKKIMEFLAT